METKIITLPGGVPLDLAWVPPGEFWMGASKDPKGKNFDPDAYEDEGPVRLVRLTKGFWLGLHPITNAQYRAFTRDQGHRDSNSWGREGFDSDEQPVTGVDWEDATAFCAWVKARLGERMSLPTEAQWEWAACGSEARKYPWGSREPVPELAVFGGAPLAAVSGRPAGAGPFGHQDLAGHVWEWCLDTWEDKYPEMTGVDVNPCRQVSGAAPRVVRGGSWLLRPRSLRAAYRDWWHPGLRVDYLGFRVCCLREPEE